MRHLVLSASLHNALWALIREIDDGLSKEGEPQIDGHKPEDMVHGQKGQVLERAIRRIVHDILVFSQKILSVLNLLRHGKTVVSVDLGGSRRARSAEADHIRPLWLIAVFCLLFQQFCRAQHLHFRVLLLLLGDNSNGPGFCQKMLGDILLGPNIQQQRHIPAHQNAPEHGRPHGRILQLNAHALIFCPDFLFQRLAHASGQRAVCFICNSCQCSIFFRQLRRHPIAISAHDLKHIAKCIALGKL